MGPLGFRSLAFTRVYNAFKALIKTPDQTQLLKRGLIYEGRVRILEYP